MYKLTGVIKVIKEQEKVSDKFSKREFVVTTQDQYPQEISFQLTQDKCSLLDQFAENDQVEVSFNLKGREWTQGEVKYFNTLEAWRIVGNKSEPPKTLSESLGVDPPKDDLPF